MWEANKENYDVNNWDEFRKYSIDDICKDKKYNPGIYLKHFTKTDFLSKLNLACMYL